MHMHISEIDEVARQLPFDLDAAERICEVFDKWLQAQADEERHIINLWIYCFTRRYFLVKFLQEPDCDIADFEALIEKVYFKVEENLLTVRESDRFVNWVSRICRNTFLNYLRGRRSTVSLDRNPGAYDRVIAADEAGDGLVHDQLLVRQALLNAITKLPAYLQDIAHARFVEQHSCERIAERTGRSVTTIRAYVSKIIMRFRADPGLMALMQELQE